MIYGVGTDIVEIARIQRILSRYGERFAHRILGSDEFADFQQSAHPASFLARRFAAKEAAVKALGTGIGQGLSLRDISVTHDVNGRPQLCYRGAAETLRRGLGVGSGFLSIADERDYAIAFVTLVHAPD